MLIIPAIDIKNGKCVRLLKGQFDKETVVADDPVAMAKTFEQEGATWLHVVDLDGAQKGTPQNIDIITEIKNQTSLKIQVGGGLRDVETIQKILDLDIDKLILGTVAIKNPFMIAYLKKTKLIIGADAINGEVMIKGWQEGSKINIYNLIKTFDNQGIEEFIFTDIEKDGTLTSPNFEEISQIREKYSWIELGVSGGISKAEHLEQLQNIKVDKVIIGKALYTNQKLREYVSQKNYTMS